MQISPIYLNTHAPFVPYCWNFEKIGLNSKVFGVELKTYDPSSPLSSPHCCLFPALRQQSFIRGKGLSSISGGTGGDFLWMNSKCFSLLIILGLEPAFGRLGPCGIVGRVHLLHVHFSRLASRLRRSVRSNCARTTMCKTDLVMKKPDLHVDF